MGIGGTGGISGGGGGTIDIDDPDLSGLATDVELNAHINDATAAHAASAISFTPAGTIAGTNVQTAVAEVATDAAGSLSSHTGQAEGAHAATAIANTPAGTIAATTVQAAINELDGDRQANSTAISDHLADTSAAHAASAISFTPTGSVAATDVQAAIAEVALEASGGGAGSISAIGVSAKSALDPASIGDIDWLHSPGASSSGVADFETATTRHQRKMTGGAQIKQRLYNQGSATASTAAGDDSWSWTDGLVSLSSNDSQRLTLSHASAINFGYMYSFPAGKVPKIAHVAWHLFKSSIRCRAWLTDGSAAMVQDTSQSDLAADQKGWFDITYNSAEEGARLIVIIDVTANGTNGIIGTQGACLEYA